MTSIWLRTLPLLAVAFVLCTGACSEEKAAPPTPHVDRILVVKARRTLMLMNKGKVVRTFKVALGRDPVGAKVRMGDHKTPEGLYSIDFKNRTSKFHLALHISYPTATDRERSQALGVDPGGAIMIHGLPNTFGWLGRLHTLIDWTDGCIAVTNEEIEEIWKLVPAGTPVEILP